ncbi:MAG: FkbM family methyltransferase [Bacteroidales bacterium]|nr:FkbM family methyltransferase [Bacteroidales bacterium]
MNKLIFNLYTIGVPKPIRTAVLKKNLRRKILEYYSALPEEEINYEQRELLEFLGNNPLTIFPYHFHYKYDPGKIEVLHDPLTGLYYVFQDGKKLFFKKQWSKKRIRKAYAELSREQDPESPHRYLSETFSTGQYDVIADIGAAEGNFPLSVIENIRKLYLVEYNSDWNRALEATYAPWKDKVEIINKIVSDIDDDNHISLDTLIKTRPDITFLKIDVDGNESKVLEGAKKLLSGSSRLKIVLCTYHKGDDEEEFTSLLVSNGFSVSPSKGYMIHYYDKMIKVPWLRRGLIRASR